MTAPEMHYTRIRMVFWVPLFVEACDIYKSMDYGDDSNDTLVCDFLRKHIFAPVIEQAAEVEKEFAPKNKNDRPQEWMMARRFGSIFGQLARSVKQIKTHDMVTVDMCMFTPMIMGKPKPIEAIRGEIENAVFGCMKNVATDLSDHAQFGTTYREFVDQIERMQKSFTAQRDRFTHYELFNETRNAQI